MTEYNYMCIKVQQTPDSLPLYVSTAKANELLKWCDVPRSREGFMAGYQRELEGRHEKITDFFEQDPKNNIVPNSVIVAIDASRFQVEKVSNAYRATIKIKEPDWNTLLMHLIDQFEQRLSDEEIESIDLEDGDRDDDEEEEEETQDTDAATPPASYLAELTKHLRAMRDAPDSLTTEQKKVIYDYANSVSLPGLIIDGQHRVYGAKEVTEFDVEFPVVFIPGLDFSEQVFHFYVLNNKAKPLSRTHLRRIISTSLSKGEIDQLYERLRSAGVEARSAEWTHRMNNDSESPFKGLIDMGLQGSRGAINENVAYQVVSKFMLLHNRYRLLTENIAQWDTQSNDYRLRAFYTVWHAVKDCYPTAWRQAENPDAPDEDRQLFFKVSLLMLQQYILDTLNADMPRRRSKGDKSPLADLVELKSEVGYTLPFLKEEFFLKPWKLTGLDTSTGHDVFRKTMDKAIQNESKNLGNMSLFKVQG